ncbi:hypothetical protein Fot_28946 [Forsythia ovata]|uniref:Uncharacterized protein n=1 Tax=Forsythia ovata TaxID=205694 RepID=A0ABD1TQG4_9LAMI
MWGQRLPNEAIHDMYFQATLWAQAFNRYLPHSWKAFVTEGDMDDLLEASIACSIRAAFASMKSLNALKEYKKKVTGEKAKANEFCAAMDSMMMTVDSAKAAYQKMRQDLAEAEENVTALTEAG